MFPAFGVRDEDMAASRRRAAVRMIRAVRHGDESGADAGGAERVSVMRFGRTLGDMGGGSGAASPLVVRARD